MMPRRSSPESSHYAGIDGVQSEGLTVAVERSILGELADCRRKLDRAHEGIEGAGAPRVRDDPQAPAPYIADTDWRKRPEQASPVAIRRRYCELRVKLALANIKLVAHVAKRFRDRGIPHSDLMQEGFCGLLTAIDRFDLAHETKLATYAIWWIRQAMQTAVASGAYPVRLTPRHLRRLAQDQEQRQRMDVAGDHESRDEPDEPGGEIIYFIHAATRPAVSLDAVRDATGHCGALLTIHDPDGDRTSEAATFEAITRLIEAISPREQEVLSLRFGLGGRERLSLSQVGRLLHVSKERVRQIGDRALEKLRARADHQNLAEKLSWID